MEYLYSIKETHTRSITALGYNPARRELLIGCEDGVVKVWEAETGYPVQSIKAHRGWVTHFLYWPQMKLVLSCGHDSVILFWSGNTITDKVYVDGAVYTMTMNPRKKQLLCGTANGIRLYELDESRVSGHYINVNSCYHAKEHRDIVKCICVHDTRVYSAGFDQRLIIYDSSYTGEKEMLPTVIISRAHDAGINNLVIARDNENNAWIVTGGFDKCIKIWSTDGKVVHKIDNFMTSITGLVYIPRNRTVWATGGAPYAWIYDPKSGENVSEFCGTFVGKENEKYQLQLMKFYPEMNMVIGSTSRRHLIAWKYQPSACVTTLNNEIAVESLAYTRKLPILLFSGDHKGELMKWERKQSNQFAYRYRLQGDKRSARLRWIDDSVAKKPTVMFAHDREAFKATESMQRLLKKKMASRQRALDNKPQTSMKFNANKKSKTKRSKSAKKTFLRLHYVEELDLLIAACEDGNLYIFGYDERAVQVLLNMEPEKEKTEVNKKFAILVEDHEDNLSDVESVDSQEDKKRGGDDVTRRVAGFTCRSVLMEHHSVVTSFCVVRPSVPTPGPGDCEEADEDSNYYLISSGWDQRLCVWNLRTGDLCDVFRNANSKTWEERELAADDVVLDMCFNPDRREFAYSCADNMVYIRRFSPIGTELHLLNTLQGHEAEITCVRWYKGQNGQARWITGSEDHTIRLWEGTGFNDCLQTLNTGGPVYSLCIDETNGAIVAGVGNELKVFDPEDMRLVQTNRGHQDSIRAIVHVVETGQYVSASWDGHINLWASWHRCRRSRPQNEAVISFELPSLPNMEEVSKDIMDLVEPVEEEPTMLDIAVEA